MEGLNGCVHCAGCAAKCPLTNRLKKAKTLDQENADSVRRVCALSGGLGPHAVAVSAAQA